MFDEKTYAASGKKAKVDELQTRKRTEPVVQRSAAASILEPKLGRNYS